MKVSKAQAQANRAHIVETASILFREHGYDGVGVADLMGAAGFTHGGFYKHFRSKAELMAESAACGMAQTAQMSAGADTSAFVAYYLSRAHRDARATGCTMAALGADAARQPEAVRTTFAAGIETLLAAMHPDHAHASSVEARARTLDMLAHAVGAIVMSRACPDGSPLADEILAACRERILGPSSAAAEAPAG